MLCDMDRATYLKRLGETVEPGGRRPAPEPLRLIQQFVNTYNYELGPTSDRLRTIGHAKSWLIQHGLLARRSPLTARDLATLRDLRAALRDLVVAHSHGEDDANAVRRLNRLGGPAPVRVVLEEGGGARLEAAASGARAAVGDILAIVYRAMAEGTWPRLKACRECEWLFFDRSKNLSAGWCSMTVCGNRVKNRAYRRRIAAAPRLGARP
jgi:predicted RNA-binding Zn ribbon-like protein